MKHKLLPLDLNKTSYNPLHVVLPYVLVSGLWIFLSDRVLLLFTQDPHRISVLSIYKGWAFVLVTGTMLYFLVRNSASRLRSSNDNFRELFNSMAQGVIYQDLSGAITVANHAAEEILGVSLREMTGIRSTDVLWRTIRKDGSAFPRNEHPSMVALSSGKPVTNVLMGIFHPKLNEYRWILIDSIPQFRLGETIPYQVFSTFTDMTNRTKVEEEFEQLNKTLEQRVIERTSDLESFTYSVAHDLRAPLRAIDGFSGILVEDYKALLDDTGKNVIRKIRDNVLQMDELMFGLLEFSRMGRSDMMKTEFSMATVVEECYQKLTTPESREKISFTMKGHCKVCADKAMMYHVWGNLLSNAIKFTSRCETPEITVTCNTENKMNIFRISDNGAGFDMRYKDKLFGVFQRLHSTREYSGTGVGLAIVQRIIHRHGGKIWAEAEVGKGATFYFTLDQAG